MPETAIITFACQEEMAGFFGAVSLIVTPEAVDLTRVSAPSGLSMLADHNGSQPLGRVERARIEGEVGYAEVRLESTKRSEPYIEELRAGIRDGISPGFLIHEAEIRETADGDFATVITRWEPYEISSTPIPRMRGIGLISLVDEKPPPQRDPSTEGAPSSLRRRSARERTERQPSARALAITEASMLPVSKANPRIRTTEERMSTLREQEAKVDLKLGELHRTGDAKPETVQTLRIDEAINRLALHARNPSGPGPKGVTVTGAQVNYVSARAPSVTAALVSSDVFGSEIESPPQRGDIQPTGRRAERLLRLCRQASIPYASTRFPVLSSAPTSGMVAEGAAALTLTDASFADPAPEATMHAGQVRASYSLLSALQGGPTFRQMIDDSIRIEMFNLQARQLVAGDGVAPNVRGLLNTPNVGTSEYASTDRGAATSFETAEDVLDAAEYGAESRPTWLLSPDLYRTARKTLREPGDGRYVLERAVILDEFQALKADGLTANQAVLFDAAYVVFAVWDQSDLIVDMITKPGNVLVTLTTLFDAVPIRASSIVLMDQA